MKFKGKNFNEKKQAYADLVTSGASIENQSAAYMDMMDALQEDITSEIKNNVDERLANIDAQRRHDSKITANEIKFFDEVKTDTTNKDEKILPQETVDEIFEDLTTEHPFLATIGLKTTGLRLKFLKSEATGKAVWGKIYDEIKGQLDQVFTDEEATQSKLTAFVALPKDAEEYGAAWLKEYAVTQIVEVFAVAMEEAFLVGDGNSKPIGLNRQVQKDVAVTGGVYPEKEAKLTLTLANPDATKNEFAEIIKQLSVKENGKSVVAKGKAVVAIRPGDDITLEAAATIQNDNGQWVYALPFGVKTTTSVFVPVGKAIAFLPDRYDAYTSGDVKTQLFNQTLALEDMNLYTAKQFVYGKAKDNNASVVVNFTPAESTTGDTPKA